MNPTAPNPNRRRSVLVAAASAAMTSFAAYLLLAAAPSGARAESEFLDPVKLNRVRFSVTGHDSDLRWYASVTFQSPEGYQKLGPGGEVRINGETIPPSALQPRGWWYPAVPKKVAAYEVEFILGPGQPAVRRQIPARPFSPVLPELVSRGKPLVLQFTGAPPQAGEELRAEMSNEENGKIVWRRVLAPVAAGNTITIPTAVLAGAVLGQSKLSVNIVRRSADPDRGFEATYQVGEERMVWLTN